MLAVEKIILFILFLIVLFLSLYVMFGTGKVPADKLLLQYQLTQCCGTWRAYGCSATALPQNVICDSGYSIEALRIKLDITSDQLDVFCKC